MKNLLILFTILYSTHSQSQLFNWAKTLSGSSDEFATSIAVDDSSNTYVVGYFQSSINFTKSIGTITLTSSGSYDIFISKFDCAGNALWATKIGGTGNEKSPLNYGGIIFNKSDNSVVVCSSFEGIATAYSLNGSNQTLSSVNGSRDAVVASFTSGGSLNWVNKYGSSGDDRAEAICMDPSGNIIVRGEFENTVAFGSTNLTSAGSTDLYTLKLTSSGTKIWVIKDGGTGYEATNNRISTDKNGNVYVSGNTDGTFTLGSYTVTHYGSWGGYFVKYDANGNVKWVTKGSNTGSSGGHGIVVDSAFNVFFASDFTGNVTFYDGSNNGISFTSTYGLYDVAIFKLDSSGNFIWGKRTNGSGDELAFNIAIDRNSNIYINGYFSGTFGFGSYSKVSNGNLDAFILQLDSSGNKKNAMCFGGTGKDINFFVEIDETGILYACGTYSGTASFGGNSLTSIGYSDAFFAKTRIDSSFTFLPNDTALCNIDNYSISCLIPASSYAWSTNDTASSIGISTTGWYSLRILHNCDYLVDSIYISISQPVQPIITRTGNTLHSNSAAGNQWYLNTVPITGATSQSYTPLVNGIYSLQVLSSGCYSPMSDTLNFVITGINFKEYYNINIYPNPFRNEILISSNENHFIREILIFDINGRAILKTSLGNTNSIKLNTTKFADGVYILRIVGYNGDIINYKMIK